MMCGSDAMYDIANCRMDQVTNSAIGKNSMEYWSILKLSGILKFMVNFHSQCEVILSNPEYMKSVMGIRLVKKAILIVAVRVLGEFWKFFNRRGRSMGVRVIVSVSSMVVLRSRAISITFTWICTKISGS